MSFTEQQVAALVAPLDPAHVKKPSGSFGPKGDYLEGWHVINEMNRVFGFDGWSYTIELSRDALDHVEVIKQGRAPEMQWQAAYTCICTLKVGEVTRQDVGFGSGFAKLIGDAVEGATKEAATDALKRAARTFGNAFGLALYDKSRANVGVAEPELAESDRIMLEGIEACQTVQSLNEWLLRNKQVALASARADQITDAWNQRKAAITAVSTLTAG
jgi:DNA recombination protein Rad52